MTTQTLQQTQKEIENSKIANEIANLQTLEMTNEPAFNFVASTYDKARKFFKRTEDARKNALAPHKEEINRINFQFKQIQEPLEEIIALCNKKTGEYQTYITKKEQERQKKILEAAAMLAAKTPIVLTEPVKPKSTESVIAKTKTITKFKVIDISKVPLEYLEINKSAVDRDIKMGVRNIEGLEIYEESITTLARR